MRRFATRWLQATSPTRPARERVVADAVGTGARRGHTALARDVHRRADPGPRATHPDGGLGVLSPRRHEKLGELRGSRACSIGVDDLPSPDGATSLRSSQALLRATLARDGITAMRRGAELAAKIETKPGTSWYAEAKETLGTARWLSGATRQAIHPLQIAAREGRAFNWSADSHPSAFCRSFAWTRSVGGGRRST